MNTCYLSQFWRRPRSVKAQPSVCIYLFLLSHPPTGLPSLLPPTSVFYLLGWHEALALAALSIKRHLLLVIVCSPSCPECCRWVAAMFHSYYLFSFFHPPDEMSSRLTDCLCKHQVSVASWGMLASGEFTEFLHCITFGTFLDEYFVVNVCV